MCLYLIEYQDRAGQYGSAVVPKIAMDAFRAGYAHLERTILRISVNPTP